MHNYLQCYQCSHSMRLEDYWERGEQQHQVKVTRKDRLNGSVAAVTVISPPSSTSSNTFFSRLGRVAASSWGGACKYICLIGVDSDGFLIWLLRSRELMTSCCEEKAPRTYLASLQASRSSDQRSIRGLCQFQPIHHRRRDSLPVSHAQKCVNRHPPCKWAWNSCLNSGRR